MWFVESKDAPQAAAAAALKDIMDAVKPEAESQVFLPTGPSRSEQREMAFMQKVLNVLERHIQQEKEHLEDVGHLRSTTPRSQSMGALAALQDLQEELEEMEV